MRFRMASAFLAILTFGIADLWAQRPAAPPPPVPEPSAQTQPIRRRVDLVNVLFTVLDKRNRIVSDLNQQDFKVFDDSVLQEIRFFGRQSDLPLRVGLLLDTSNSIRPRLQFQQEAAINFLYNVLRKGKDQAFIMTVDDIADVVQDLTGDLDLLRDVILRQRAGGGTALNDGIFEGANLLAREIPSSTSAGLSARGILVVISDGNDNLSLRSRDHALETAQRAGIVIYTISSSPNWVTLDKETSAFSSASRKFWKDKGDRVLEQFAEKSGGRAFFPYRVDDLAQSFADIGEELRSQYSLAYVPNRSPDGKYHEIRVEVDGKDLKVQARKGYYAEVAEELGPPLDTQGN